MELTNFLSFKELMWDGDEEFGEDLSKILNCSLDEIYVVGDDNEELETEGVSYYLGDYFSSKYNIGTAGDEYITITKRGDVTIAWTSDHGYTNWYVAKNDIAKIPSEPDYKKFISY